MNKKLFLAIVPFLALAMTACGGGEPTTSAAPTTSEDPISVPATSEEQPTSQEEESQPAPTSEEESQPAPTSQEPVSEDPVSEEDEGEGYDTLKGVGKELQVGSKYYEFIQDAEPGLGRKESYTIASISFEEGQKVTIYVDGLAVTAWADADFDNEAYPNYKEKPQSEQYSTFTVYSTDDGAAYLHLNQDDSYSLWLTPAHLGSDEETSDAEFYVVGSFNGWAELDPQYGMTDNLDGTYSFERLELPSNAQIKVIAPGDPSNIWYGEHGASDGNMKVAQSGIYTVTFNPNADPAIVLNKTGDYDTGDTSYRLVGTIGSADCWSFDAGVELVRNEEAGEGIEEYMLETAIDLAANDGIKVLDNNGSWYPDGMGNEYKITAAGSYQIYFRPAGNAEWGETFYFTVVAA